MTRGTDNFRTSTLERHAECADHINSIKEIAMQNEFNTAVKSTLSEQDMAVECAMATAYWLVKKGCQ